MGSNLTIYYTILTPMSIHNQAIVVRPIFIPSILRPRIFESKLRNHCAKKLDGARAKTTLLPYFTLSADSVKWMFPFQVCKISPK